MRHAILLPVIMLLTAVTPALPVDPPQEHAAASAEATQDFEARMRHFMWRHGVPGAAVAVAVDGKIVYEQGFGWADVDKAIPVTPASRFRIASITKPFTAVAILQLVEQGKLSLDDNPFELIGLGNAIKAPSRDPRLAKITVKQLLAHEAGWNRDNGGYDPMFHEPQIIEALELQNRPDTNDVIRFMIDQPLNFDPGTRHAYSNFGYCLLGRVIEHVSGKGYEEFVAEQVLSPLGIDKMKIGRSLQQDRFNGEVVYYDRSVADQTQGSAYTSDPELMDAHGGWIASASDLARFAGAFSDPANCPLLKEETIETMWTPTPTDRSYIEFYSRGEGYGLGWWAGLRHDGLVDAEHSGLLLGSASRLTKYGDGCAVAVLFNANHSALTSSTLDNQFHSELLSHAHRLGQLHLEPTAMPNE